MNISFLFSLPSSLAEYKGVKKLLCDAASLLSAEDTNDAGETGFSSLFCGCDPQGQPLGSGGGTVHLLHERFLEEQAQQQQRATTSKPTQQASSFSSFLSWLRLRREEGRIVVHAGGLSRRLPAYATLGKALLPLPPCRWHRGSALTRTLLSTQVPLYGALVTSSPPNLRTLIACGDICVYVRTALPSLARFIDTDVLCLGVRTDPQLLPNHGVFFMSRRTPYDLEFMLQKPALAEVRRCATEGDCSFLLDVGLWMLSDRAVEVLTRKCVGAAPAGGEEKTEEEVDIAAAAKAPQRRSRTIVQHPYDLYSEFGAALGSNSLRSDPEVSALKASVLELTDAEFLHYGTNRQLISSTQMLRTCESPVAPSWSSSAPFDGVLLPSAIRQQGNARESQPLEGVSMEPLHMPDVPSLAASPPQGTASSLTEDNKGYHTPSLLHTDSVDTMAGDALSLLATPSSVLVHNAVVQIPLDGSTASRPSSRSATTTSSSSLCSAVRHLWVESSWIGPRWRLHGRHILTGIPPNNWPLELPAGICVSVVPLRQGVPHQDHKDSESNIDGALAPCAARPYHMDDTFRGDVWAASTLYMGVSMQAWLSSRGLALEDIVPEAEDTAEENSESSVDNPTKRPLDIYEARLFPVCTSLQQLGDFLYLATLPVDVARDARRVDTARFAAGQAVWRRQPRLSATALLHRSDVRAMLDNSAFYEKRNLAVTLALVASHALCDGTAVPTATSFTNFTPQLRATDLATSSAERGSGKATATPVLSSAMIQQLQQQFFLLDLDRVARRVVDLQVPIPREVKLLSEPGDEIEKNDEVTMDQVSALTAPESQRGSLTSVVAEASEWTAAPASASSAAATAAEPFAWASIFAQHHHSFHGEGLEMPACSVPARIGRAHFHLFVRRVMELQQRKMERATSETEKKQCLSLLRAASVEEAQGQMQQHDAAAFAELRAAILHSFPGSRSSPSMGVHLDQIIWGRCPIRIDLAGAWTDTPPYTLLNGGNVINVAVELNGQPPVQVYVRVRKDPVLVIHSIDSGERTVLTSYDDIRTYATMQNPFSIPKAALALCGFLPEFCTTAFPSLAAQLHAQFGGHGLELSLLVAIPTGSGLGTSSIVSGVVLRSLAEFCKLTWDEHAVCRRVLLIEQMLTAGGGWQDQYGGLFPGLKLVQSRPGLPCVPTVRWMPSSVFTDPRYSPCHLLYYTGITRMAKGILEEIVRDVFLNKGEKLQLLHEIGGAHTAAMYDTITSCDYEGYAALIQKTWEQKKRLDDGVCNASVQAIVNVVEPYVLGLTLPGAGGGGYLYMCAKDAAAARQIREALTRHPPNANARFVEMTVSTTGMQVSRS